MATAESVKAKLQGLIANANAKTGKIDSTLTDAVRTLIGGYGQGGSGIIDVDELPTENIDKNAVYRVGGDGSSVSIYLLDNINGYSGFLEELLGASGTSLRYHVVDTLPAVLELTSESTRTVHIYILKGTGLAYWQVEGEDEPTLFMDADESAFKGLITAKEFESLDKNDPNNDGFYIVDSSYDTLYVYENGSWSMLVGIITVEDLTSTDKNMNAIYRKPKMGAEIYVVMDGAVYPFYYVLLLLSAFAGMSAPEKVYYIVVDMENKESIATTPILEKTRTIWFVYVDAHTGRAYTVTNGEYEYMFDISGLPKFKGIVDHIPTVQDGQGVYTYMKTEYDYYLPKSSGFTKIAPVDETIEFQEAEIYKPYSQLVSRTITDVDIDASQNGIGAYAFAGCSSLKTVKIGYRCDTIGEFAFLNCTALESVTIQHDAGVLGFEIHIASNAFAGCTKLKDVYVGWKQQSENPPNGDYKYATPASEWLPSGATIHYKGTWG